MNETTSKLMTAAEVIALLRLDCRGTNPKNTLSYLIRTGQIKTVKVAGRNLFTDEDVYAFLDRCMHNAEMEG